MDDRALDHVITQEWVHKHGAGSFTKAQLAIFGVGWPPPKGWLHALLGRVISAEDKRAFESLRSVCTSKTMKRRANRVEKVRTRHPRPILTPSEYHDYIASEAWRVKSRQAKEWAGGRCQICNTSKGPLDAHHRTYERLGNEALSDLTVLCRTCHALFEEHKRLLKSPPPPTPVSRRSVPLPPPRLVKRAS